MAITFAARGDSLDARYGGNGVSSALAYAAANSAPEVAADATPGIIDGTVIDLYENGGAAPKAIKFQGGSNFPQGKKFSILARFLYVPDPTTISAAATIFEIGDNAYGGIYLRTTGGTGILRVVARPAEGLAGENTFLPVTTQAVIQGLNEVFITVDATKDPCEMKFYHNGALHDTYNTPSAYAGDSWSSGFAKSISFGNGTYPGFYIKINEFVIWDDVVACPDFNRTEFIEVDEFDGTKDTDPGIANVLSGVSYYLNGTELTGTLNAPTPSGAGIGVLDIYEIKEKLRWILNQNNSALSTVRDLSEGMDTRVKIVTKLNPIADKMEADKIPGVAIWVEHKPIKNTSIGRNQIDVKRETTLSIKIAGFVFNSNFSSVLEDDADSDCERLMENIEAILRAYPTIDGEVLWQTPTDVTYHDLSMGESSQLKVGIMHVDAKGHY